MPVQSVHQGGVGGKAVSAKRAAGLAIMLAGLALLPARNGYTAGETRTISLHHIHTGEDITITYKVNGQYDEAALQKLNHFVRDWRKNEEVRMDPRLYDIMWEVQHEIGFKGPIHIVCGYRSPATNAMLRSRSSGVARTSLHMAGKAMDVSFPGADVAKVRAAALRVQAGGVGYYPTSGVPFVHMDVGNVRHWPRMTRDQLAKVFPDGRTLHVPSDGHPLPGYALALADRERGTTDRLLNRPKARSLLASVFKPAPDDEEVADQVSLKPAVTPTRAAVASVTPVVATETTTKPVPLPPQRPMFQIATAESRLVTMPKPSGAMKVAAPTPNDVITLRGYWEGPQTVAQPVRATAPRRPIEDAALTTASLNPKDRIPPEVAMAYAAQGEPPVAAAPLSRPAAIASRGTASIAVKPPTASQPLSTVRDAKLNDPWLSALILAPSVQAMTMTTFGAPDFTTLHTFFQKPASSVMMTFSADPHLGMTSDRFTGSAVVFQATVTYSTRAAALQLSQNQ